MNIAYIVSMICGMESFIYREVEYLTEKKDIGIVLYATKYKKNDVFSPKSNWKYYKINFIKALLDGIIYFVSSPIKAFGLLVKALKTNTLVDFVIANHYSRSFSRENTKHIHCHFGDHKFFIGVYLKLITNLTLSLTVHAHEIYANPNEGFFRFGLSITNSIICISDKNKELIIKNFNADPKKVKVIRLSSDAAKFENVNKFKVLVVARFVERKGFRVLFNAIKTLNRTDLEFIIIGFGPMDLRKIVSDMGISDKVMIFDKMDASQIRLFMQICNCFILPSITTKEEGQEGIPVALMEAMAAEMPVITTDNGSICELVTEEIVEQNDPIQLAKAIEKVAAYSEEKRREIGRKNRWRVVELHGDVNRDILYDEFIKIAGK